MKQKTYLHLCFEERKKIEKFLKNKLSIREISRKLFRSVSCISNEIKENSVNGIYNAKKAQHKAYLKRKESKFQCLKVVNDVSLKEFVIENIKDHQSPEGISGRLKKIRKDLKYVSTKGIYKFVESPYGRQIERFLYSKSVRRKSGPKNKKKVSIDGRIMINKRPKRIENRLEFGHFEGDFIESGRDGVGSILVLVERKTRYPFLAYLDNRSTKNVNNLIGNLLKDIPIKSLTLDNDISFQKHRELSELINASVFFCFPGHPEQKPQVENRNKSIRRYLPKRCDLSTYSSEYIKTVESKLRDKFMKCLNYKTPRECFVKELDKIKLKKPLVRGMISSILEVK